MLGRDSGIGECPVSEELLWNRLSDSISLSNLYLRGNVACGLKAISITWFHFINFRTITRQRPFDSCSSFLSRPSKKSMWELIVKLSLSCSLKFTKHCVSAISTQLCQKCIVCTTDIRAVEITFLTSKGMQVSYKNGSSVWVFLNSCKGKFAVAWLRFSHRSSIFSPFTVKRAADF